MKRLRHIVAVDIEEHGSPLASYNQYKKDGKDWIEIIPKRAFSIFEFDSKVDGAKRTPKILFGRKEAIFSFKQPNIISYTNFPSTYEFLIFPFLSPDLFTNKIIERAEVFCEIKNYINFLHKNFEPQVADIDNCVELIKIWKKHNSLMLPYMFLSLTTDEIIFNSFQNILFSEKGHSSTIDFLNIFTSQFAANAKKNNFFIPTLREFAIPPLYEIPPIAFPENNEKELKSILKEFNFHLKNEKGLFLDRFINTHSVLSKLQYQLTEETYYVWQTYAILINHVLYKLEQLLNKHTKLTMHLTDNTILEIETLIKTYYK